MTVPRQEKTGNGDSSLERQHHFLARNYAGELLDRALEANEYRSATMLWSPEEHPSVMAELRKIRETLAVVPQALSRSG